jgi:hypothetical protein
MLASGFGNGNKEFGSFDRIFWLEVHFDIIKNDDNERCEKD